MCSLASEFLHIHVYAWRKKQKTKKKDGKTKSVKCPLFSVRTILCIWERCCTLYLAEPSIVNFLIMPPWFHIWTELQHINHQSVCVCMHAYACVCCYLWLFMCFPAWLWQCVAMFHRSSSRQCVLIGLVTDWCIIHQLMKNYRWLLLWVHECVSARGGGSLKVLYLNLQCGT